jgi:hypothetical protein
MLLQKVTFASISVDNWSGLIRKVIPTSHNVDPEYCPVSEERQPFRKNPQQILVFCTCGWPLRRWFCGDPFYVTGRTACCEVLSLPWIRISMSFSRDAAIINQINHVSIGTPCLLEGLWNIRSTPSSSKYCAFPYASFALLPMVISFATLTILYKLWSV